MPEIINALPISTTAETPSMPAPNTGTSIASAPIQIEPFIQTLQKYLNPSAKIPNSQFSSNLNAIEMKLPALTINTQTQDSLPDVIQQAVQENEIEYQVPVDTPAKQQISIDSPVKQQIPTSSQVKLQNDDKVEYPTPPASTSSNQQDPVQWDDSKELLKTKVSEIPFNTLITSLLINPQPTYINEMLKAILSSMQESSPQEPNRNNESSTATSEKSGYVSGAKTQQSDVPVSFTNSTSDQTRKSMEPVTTFEMVPNQRAGPIKIPDTAFIPPSETKTEEITRENQAAGPRPNPQITADKGDGLNPRNPEEAVKSGTTIEIPKVEPRHIDWLNEVFRKPVNELTRDGFRFPEDVQKSYDMKASNIDAKSDKTQVEITRIGTNDAAVKLNSQTSNIPEYARKIEIIQPQVSTNEQNGTKTDSGEKGDQSSNSKQDHNSKVKMEILARLHSTGISRQQPVNSTQSQNDSVFKENLLNMQPKFILSSSKQMPVETLLKSAVLSKSSGELKNEPAITTGFVSAAGNSEGSIKMGATMHILDDIPSRIAAEIKHLEDNGNIDKSLMTLRVQLRPPRLGPLEIEISRTSDGLDVKLVTRTAFAKELITQRGDEIRQALENHGINVRKFEINYSGHNHSRDENIGSFTNPHGMPYGRNNFESAEKQSHELFNEDDFVNEVESELSQSQSDIPREYRRLNIIV